MSGAIYNKQIEIISSMMKSDGISPDENEPTVLSKYHEYAKTEFGLNDETSAQLIYESLIYLKLHDSDMDPLSDGEKFGVGFS